MGGWKINSNSKIKISETEGKKIALRPLTSASNLLSLYLGERKETNTKIPYIIFKEDEFYKQRTKN